MSWHPCTTKHYCSNITWMWVRIRNGTKLYNNSNSNSNSNNNLPQPYPTCSLAWLAALMQQQQQQQQQQPFILAQPPLPQLPPNEAALQVALRLGLFSSLSSTTPSSTRQTPPTQPHVSLSVQGLPPTTSTSAEAIAAAALCGAWTNTATPHTHDNSVTRLLATLAAAWMAGGGGPTNTGFPATTSTTTTTTNTDGYHQDGTTRSKQIN